MYVYVYICMCTVCVYVYVYSMCVCVCVYVYVYSIYVCMCMCICVCVQYVYMCMCICMCTSAALQSCSHQRCSVSSGYHAVHFQPATYVRTCAPPPPPPLTLPSFLDRDASKFYILLELGSMDLTQVIRKKREHGCWSLWMRTLWYDMLLAVKVSVCVCVCVCIADSNRLC